MPSQPCENYRHTSNISGYLAMQGPGKPARAKEVDTPPSIGSGDIPEFLLCGRRGETKTLAVNNL